MYSSAALDLCTIPHALKLVLPLAHFCRLQRHNFPFPRWQQLLSELVCVWEGKRFIMEL